MRIRNRKHLIRQIRQLQERNLLKTLQNLQQVQHRKKNQRGGKILRWVLQEWQMKLRMLQPVLQPILQNRKRHTNVRRYPCFSTENVAAVSRMHICVKQL